MRIAPSKEIAMSKGPAIPEVRLAGRRDFRWRASLLAAATSGLALLAAACGPPGPAASTAHQTADQRELAYAECMRAHGLPSFPDPQSDGTFNSTKQNANDFHGPQFLSANKSCAHLEGPGMTPAQQQQVTSQALKFAACMRAHGITNFQFSEGTGGRAEMGAQGANVNSAQFQAAQQACRKLQPSGSGS
jgi:hypothetical protein